jgi:hypothetical protein
MPYFLCINGNGVSSVRTDADLEHQLKQFKDDDGRPSFKEFVEHGKEGDFYTHHHPELHGPTEKFYYVKLGRRFFDDKRSRRTRL